MEVSTETKSGGPFAGDRRGAELSQDGRKMWPASLTSFRRGRCGQPDAGVCGGFGAKEVDLQLRLLLCVCFEDLVGNLQRLGLFYCVGGTTVVFGWLFAWLVGLVELVGCGLSGWLVGWFGLVWFGLVSWLVGCLVAWLLGPLVGRVGLSLCLCACLFACLFAPAC